MALRGGGGGRGWVRGAFGGARRHPGAARGRKRHARDRSRDCRLLRELLQDGRLPASWIAPTIVLEWRQRARLYKTLVDQRSTWVQRIHAELFQHGVTLPETSIRRGKDPRVARRQHADRPAGRQRVLTAYRMIDALTIESRPLKADLQRFGRKQPGCRALVDSQYGIGGLLAVTLVLSFGDCQRFARSEQVVRHSGLDVTVDQSDRRRAGGFISRHTATDVALGALRGSEERVAPPQPGSRLLRRRERITSTASWPPSQWPARSPGAASTSSTPSTPPSSTRRPEFSRRGWWPAPPTNTSRVVSRSAPATGVPASIRAGRPSTDATADPHRGGHQSEMLSPTTSSSSTQVTQGAPAPPSLGP